MAVGGPINRRLGIALMLLAALGASGCGSSSKQEKAHEARKDPITGPGAPKGAPTPRQAIIEFFAAKRLGETEKGCSLESEDFQIAQYKGAGKPCLKAVDNQHPQTIWREDVEIDKLDEAPDSAAAIIRPTKGSNTPAEITLVRGEGGWTVNRLR